ncbi:hypothetical protein OSB04_026765 [Centaurea solstitialis]|uniref:Uncharacterized protein n=1 Tax=Centaurea solstitialis TaxID=347529 RepID=A0AA38W7J7_9ASTR|nr:hypothetical protein OSB04_026765 [Centaurea solstitialis]
MTFVNFQNKKSEKDLTPVIITKAYFCGSTDDMNVGEVLRNLIHLSAMILRLTDDLGTSSVIKRNLNFFMHMGPN